MAWSDTEYDAWVKGPEAAGEELFREGASSLFEGITEDTVPRGTSFSVFMTAFAYAIGMQAASFAPLAALGTDPVTIAKIATRGMFAGLEAMASNSRVPRPLFNLIRRVGPMTGGIKGVLDALRRDVINQLNALEANPDRAAREASLQPSLGVAQGLVQFRWDKFTGKATGAASAAGNKGKPDNNATGGLPGTGKARYIRDYLAALDAAATPGPVKDRVTLQVTNLEAFKASHPEEAADVFELSARGLMPPEEIAHILGLPDGDPVRSDKKDAQGKWILIPARDARLKALAREARKRVDEARLADGTDKPKEAKVDLSPSRDRGVAYQRRLALADASNQAVLNQPLPLAGSPRLVKALGIGLIILVIAMLVRACTVGGSPATSTPSARAQLANQPRTDGGVTPRRNNFTNDINSNSNDAAHTRADAGRH